MKYKRAKPNYITGFLKKYFNKYLKYLLIRPFDTGRSTNC